MPTTRRVFLESLAAPTHTLPIDGQCAICQERRSNPVQLPCRGEHIFCRECVISWTQPEHNNRCPVCKDILFEKERPKEKAKDWQTKNYNYILHVIEGAVYMIEHAPENALKNTAKAAIGEMHRTTVDLHRHLPNKQDFVENLGSVYSRAWDALEVIPTTNDTPAIYGGIKDVLRFIYEECQMTVAYSGIMPGS